MLKPDQEFIEEFNITTDIFEGFRDTFNDRNPMHVDREFAHAHGFKDRIMYGNILCGFISYFVGECLPTKKVVIMSQSINFHKPFFENETLVLKAKLKGLFANDTVAEFKFKFVRKESAELVAKGNIQINLMS